MTPTTSTIYIYIHETEWLRVVWIRKGKAVPIEGVGNNESNIYQCIHVSYLFLQHDINGVFLNKIDHLDNSNFDPDIQPKLLYI